MLVNSCYAENKKVSTKKLCLVSTLFAVRVILLKNISTTEVYIKAAGDMFCQPTQSSRKRCHTSIHRIHSGHF